MQQTVKKHAGHAITGFELTKKALNISSQYEIKGVTLNVLMYLTTCYNAKNKYVYPKQKTIAKMISASERSVIRAIQELVKKGLIIVECKYSNRYVFTSKLTGECPQDEKNFESEKMSEDLCKNFTSKRDKMSQHDKQQISRINKLTSVEDYKILKTYAIKMKADNIQAYINKIIHNGGAEKIIKDTKQSMANARAMENFTKENAKNLEFARANRAEKIPQVWFEMKKTILSRQ